MSAPRAKGYSSSPKGIQSHLLPHAGALTERATATSVSTWHDCRR
jgi:hypothetical protein